MFNGKVTLDRLRDPAFLQRMAPGLHVQDDKFYKNLGFIGQSAEEMEADTALVFREGYVEVPPTRQILDVGAMADVIRLLVSQNLPPVFAFCYDEFWAVYNTLDPMLRNIFGGDYYRLPDFWAWHVDPKKAESGWEPHRDKGPESLFPDRKPKSLTIWIPLTDATTLNGCMYLVPADRDPQYGRQPPYTTGFRIQDIRALPAEAGTMFVWNQAVMHWGSHASPRGGAPRISIALEFQSAAVPAMNSPLTKPFENMPLKQRLKLIAKQVLQYKHMYGLPGELEKWAKAA